MIISTLYGATGCQMFCYAAARRLAHKHNTELKLDVSRYSVHSVVPYALGEFNISATFATSEELEVIKKNCQKLGIDTFKNHPGAGVLDFPDNVLLDGYGWTYEGFFPGIRDILLEEFTLRNPLSPTAKKYEQKILDSECPISMHFRHGDFLYMQIKNDWFHVPPLDYYYNCLNLLKQEYKNPTVFVFSNNITWCKKNLHTDVPIVFVENEQTKSSFNTGFLVRDVEEIYLMSLCKHSINPRSTFSWWGAYLNKNPDKKIFVSYAAASEDVEKYTYSLANNKNTISDSGKWIRVPVDRDKPQEVAIRPYFSLLLVVNDDINTIQATLDSIFNQNFMYYELIIIDNVSTDGSDKICRQAIKDKSNVTFISLCSKIKNIEAWNMALNMAQGLYVLFANANDRFVPDALKNVYFSKQSISADIIHNIAYLKEINGATNSNDKKYSNQRDIKFQNESGFNIRLCDGQEAAKFLLDQQINDFLGTKFFSRQFLIENKITFDERLQDEAAKTFFLLESLFLSKNFLCISRGVYIAPNIQ